GVPPERLLERTQRTGQSGTGEERVVDGAVGHVEQQGHVVVVAAEYLGHGVNVVRLGDDQLQRADQIRRGTAELAQRALQRLQVGMQGAACFRQVLVGV